MTLKNRDELKGKLLGVEIEYYPRTYATGNQSKPDIEVEEKGDGSLGAGGREITALTWMTDGLRLRELLGLRIDGAVRKTCGLHVHVDARHLGQNGLLTAEETFDKLCELHNHIRYLCPESRWSNPFCAWVNNREGAANYRKPGRGDRYAAINWTSFARHGTFEFRCQGGSTNVYKIEMWALVCQHLVNWCAQPKNKITGSMRYFDYFMAMFPEPLRSWVALRKAKLQANKAGAHLDVPRVMAALDEVEGETDAGARPPRRNRRVS